MFFDNSLNHDSSACSHVLLQKRKTPRGRLEEKASAFTDLHKSQPGRLHTICHTGVIFFWDLFGQHEDRVVEELVQISCEPPTLAWLGHGHRMFSSVQ